MKINFRKYVLASKDLPIEFDSREDRGEMTTQIEDALLYDSENEVKETVKSFDDPSAYRALPVRITYEI